MRSNDKRRDGMTLVEVMIALVILGGALLSAGAFFVRLNQASAESSIRTTASQLASDRLEAIRTSGQYSTIDANFEGTEAPVSGYPHFDRVTLVTRVGGTPLDSVDYRVITVTVSSRDKPMTVKRTTVVTEQ